MGIDHPWGARIRSLFYEDFFVGLGPCDLPARIRRSIRAAVFFWPCNSSKCAESVPICVDLTRNRRESGAYTPIFGPSDWRGHLQGRGEALGCGS